MPYDKRGDCDNHTKCRSFPTLSYYARVRGKGRTFKGPRLSTPKRFLVVFLTRLSTGRPREILMVFTGLLKDAIRENKSTVLYKWALFRLVEKLVTASGYFLPTSSKISQSCIFPWLMYLTFLVIRGKTQWTVSYIQNSEFVCELDLELAAEFISADIYKRCYLRRILGNSKGRAIFGNISSHHFCPQ